MSLLGQPRKGGHRHTFGHEWAKLPRSSGLGGVQEVGLAAPAQSPLPCRWPAE